MNEVSQNIEEFLKNLANLIIEKMSTGYWDKMREILRKEPHLKDTFPHLLLNPEKIIIYIGKKHWAIEYTGAHYQENLDVDNDELSIRLFDYSQIQRIFLRRSWDLILMEVLLEYHFLEVQTRICISQQTQLMIFCTKMVGIMQRSQ